MGDESKACNALAVQPYQKYFQRQKLNANSGNKSVRKDLNYLIGCYFYHDSESSSLSLQKTLFKNQNLFFTHLF